MAFQGQLLRGPCRFTIKALVDSVSKSSIAATSRSQARRQLASSSSSSPLGSGCFTTTSRPTAGIWNHTQFARRTLVDQTSSPKPNLPPPEEQDEDEPTPSSLESQVHDNDDGPTIESNEKIAMDNQEQDEDSENDPDASSSIPDDNALASLPEGFTSGQALYVLNNKKGPITFDEWRALCNAVRPGHFEDAGVIQWGLKEYKRTREFIITRLHATIAIKSMLRAYNKTTQDEQNNKIPAALLVMETFLDESSGLYFAASQKNVDTVLSVLLEGCQEAGLPRVADAGEDEQQQQEEPADDDDEDEPRIQETRNSTQLVVDVLYKRERKKRGARKFMKRWDAQLAAMLKEYQKVGLPQLQEEQDESALQAMSHRIANTTQQVVNMLIKRKSRPYRDMKKRAARKYLKQVRLHHGPSPKTGELATAIFCQLRGAEAAMENIVNPFQASQCPIKPETLELVETARKQEQQSQQQQQQEAVVDEEETAVAEDEEDAESSDGSSSDGSSSDGSSSDGSSSDGSSSGYESSADESSDVDDGESKEDDADKEKE